MPWAQATRKTKGSPVRGQLPTPCLDVFGVEPLSGGHVIDHREVADEIMVQLVSNRTSACAVAGCRLRAPGLDLLVDHLQISLDRAELTRENPHRREGGLRIVRDDRFFFVGATH